MRAGEFVEQKRPCDSGIEGLNALALRHGHDEREVGSRKLVQPAPLLTNHQRHAIGQCDRSHIVAMRI
jgi:hypothetical protein